MRIIYMLFLSTFSLTIGAQTPGVSIFYEQYIGDTREYIEYIPGNLPIIISAPHGGVKQSGSTVGPTFYPDNDATLPDRTCGTNERDNNTEILVREIQNEIFQLTGCYAHIIISNLHRSKLDPNREIGEAACGDSDAEDHWNAFHDFIDDASADVESVWGKGVYIDLHGQSHSIPRIEVGYNVTRGELNTGDLNSAAIINKSTISNLVGSNISEQSHEALIRGYQSLGELFQQAAGTYYASLNYPGCTHNGTNGYRAVPSDTDTGNQSCDDTRPYNNSYFDGDFYNNRRHGSGTGAHDGNGNLVGGGGSIDGIMTEVNRRVRDLGTYQGDFYDNRPPTLVPFAKDYAAVVLSYVDAHYNDFTKFDFGSCVLRTTDMSATPTIDGLAGGVFGSIPEVPINASTGVIDLASASPGTYDITYTLGSCAHYSTTKTIEIATSRVAFVDLNAAGSGDGSSWMNAYPTLEAALDAECTYDSIKVAEGTYIPDTQDRNYSFNLYSNLVIQGGHAIGGIAYDPNLYTTIISGNIGGSQETDNLCHVINVNNTVSDLELQNLHLKHGYADGSGDNSRGAGLLNKGTVKLENINLSDNKYTSNEGVIFNTGTLTGAVEVRLIDNVKL